MIQSLRGWKRQFMSIFAIDAGYVVDVIKLFLEEI